MTLRLSRRAELEFELIYAESCEQFGLAQADSYATGLGRALARLAASPQMARRREELVSRARAYRYKAHMIVYREEDDGIFIIRLPHARSDWINDPD